MRWTWFYQLGTPSWFYHKTRIWLPYLYFLSFALLLIGTVWGLGFAPVDSKQGNSYRILYIHAPVAHLAEVAYVLMAVMGATGLIWKTKLSFMAMKSSAPLGAIFTFIALVSGAIWGRPTWGTWWEWDARITSMLILFFLFLGVYALQSAYQNKEAGNKAAAILSLVGVVNVIIIKKSVDWWKYIASTCLHHQRRNRHLHVDSFVNKYVGYVYSLYIVTYRLDASRSVATRAKKTMGARFGGGY